MKSFYYHYSTTLYLLQQCPISSFLQQCQAIVLCLSPQIHSLSISSQTLFLCQPKMRSPRKVILLNTWNYLRIRDMLSGVEGLLSIGILGGARCSVRRKLMVNLVTLSCQRQGDQRYGS